MTLLDKLLIVVILVALLFSILENLRKHILNHRAQDRGDRLEDEVVRLNNLIQDKTIPTLKTATQAIQESQTYIQNLQYQLDVEKVALRRHAESSVCYLCGRCNGDDGLAGVREPRRPRG